MSGKTTALGVPMSGGQLEEYDEEQEYSQHDDDSTMNIQNGDL